MRRSIAVHLDGIGPPIGELRHDRDGRREHAAFAYTRSWLEDPACFTIDPTLQRVDGFQFPPAGGRGSIFHGAIADGEPDGWARQVIKRDHAKRRRAARDAGETGPPAILGDLDFLLAVDDESRLGALRFRDEAGVFQRDFAAESRRTPPLVELGHLLRASRAVEEHAETAADLEYLRGCGTSLGGLRPKCSVLEEDGRLAIGKFPSMADERSVTKGEVLALRLAGLAGIRVAQARLVDCDGLAVAIVRRFDRRRDGSRIPYCSAATMLGLPPGETEEHSYTELVDAIRIHGAHARVDTEELWRRIAFSIGINNVDDHLRNHGFLHVAHGQWTLAPAFDLNPFPDRERELKTWISEEAGPAADAGALLGAAPYFGLDGPRAEGILGEVRAAVARWRSVGADLGMSRTELDAFEPAFNAGRGDSR